MNLYAILPLVSLLLLIAGGFYLVRKRPANAFYRLLGISCFVLSAVEFCNFMVFTSPNAIKALFWQRGALAAALFLPVLWTLISLVFARENYRALIKRWVWYLVLLFALTLWFLTSLHKESLISSVEVVSNGYGFALGSFGRYLFIYLLLSLVVILFNFENTYRFSREEQRQKIKYSIKGISIFIGSYVILSSLAILVSHIDIRLALLGSIAIVVGFIFVARSLLSNGVGEAQVHVGRQAIYTSVTLSIVGGYLIIVGLVTKWFMNRGFNLASFFSFLAAFLVFLLFISIIFSHSLKQRLRLFIDRSFYKNKYDYRREWANLSERLGTILNVNELIDEVKKTIKQVLQVDLAEVVLENPNEELMQWLLRYGGPIPIKEFSRRQPELYEDNKQFLAKLNANILVSLNAKQKLLGILAVGKKTAGKTFSNEDMELLKIISRQVSIAILNARLSAELIVTQEMEHFHKFSSFLIHDLKNFVSTLSMVVQNATHNFNNPEFQKDSLTTISGTIIKMNRLMQKLSTLPKKLELTPKPTNINVLIEEAINELRLEDIPTIRLLRLFNYVPQIKVDVNFTEKVILNLFLNAIESMPNGGILTIKTSYQEGVGASNGSYVEIMVSDSGLGMSREFIQQCLFKPFQSSKRKGLGIGLFQSKTIVEAHGGQILVESKEGKGTTLTVRLPV